MKTIILSLTILFLSLINSFAQYEGLERSSGVEREKNYFSKPALIDSTQLDSIITEYIASENIPGATGLIFKSDGEIIWSGKYGYRNLEFQLPVEDSTLFLMASISKTFVATAIMQLWQSGLINLDGNINDYLPTGFTVVNPYHPNNIITVKMLMLHTSSLRDNWNILWPLWGCGDYPISVDTFMINYFTPGGTYYDSTYNFYNYSPGSTWNYSNSAVCLLALIIKNLTGKNFSEYTRDSILTPLSMNSSSWFLEGMDVNKIATPYRYNPPQAMCHIGMAYWPIGQLRTSIVELYNFALAYLNDGIWNNQRILDSTTIAFMLSYHGVSTPWGTQGLIWGKDSDVYNNIWGHSGAFVGTQTGMYICVEENWGILFFINLGTNPNYSPGFFPVLAQMANYAVYTVPVELTSFTATANGKEVILNWTTVTETNNSGFEILRTTKENDWDIIGYVPGHGTTTETQHYTFTDRDVKPGKYQYKLKQIDYDGTFEYSQIVEVDIPITNEFSLSQNYPNPFNPTTSLHYAIGDRQFVTLKVFDLLGREVAALVNEEKPAGEYEVEFDGTKFPSGIYFYQLKTGEFIQTKKMVLLK